MRCISYIAEWEDAFVVCNADRQAPSCLDSTDGRLHIQSLMRRDRVVLAEGDSASLESAAEGLRDRDGPVD
jgi:hypothetical protein